MARPVLHRLARLNVTAVFVGVAAFVVLALLLPDVVGGWLLLALAAGLAWLLHRTWSHTPSKVRAIRLLILGVLAGIAVIRLTG